MSSGERAVTAGSASPPPGDLPDRPGARRARGTRSGRPASVRGGGPSGGPSGPTPASSWVGPVPPAAVAGGGDGACKPSGGGPGPNQSERAASKIGSRTSSAPWPGGPTGGGLAAAGGGAAATDEAETSGPRTGGATPPAMAGASRAS